ncbi:LptF/LptG family permease [Inquilinus sp.]|uniref:LptF/LptG family permease n=1 Tax=Inquilinus sp. TaxID=1932117 RepID=UPI0031D85569
MSLLSRYMFRQIAVATALATVILVFAIMLTTSMRLIQMIVDGGVGAGLFLELVFLSMPEFLIAVLPVGVVAACLIVYNRMLSDGELLVMRGAGIGQLRLALPGLLMGLIITGVSYSMTLYFWPVANREFRDLTAIAQSDVSAAFLQTGEFNAIGDNKTVFVRDRNPVTGDLSGILVHSTDNEDQPVTIIADRGYVEDSEDGPRIVALKGVIQQLNRKTGKVDPVAFDSYTVPLNTPGAEDLARSYRAPSERFLPDLLYPDQTSPRDMRNYGRLVMEGHKRITDPLLPFAYVVFCLGVLLSGDYNRRGLSRRILIAAIGVVAVQATTMSVAGVARDSLGLIPIMYVLPVLTTVTGFVILLIARRRKVPTAAPANPDLAPA